MTIDALSVACRRPRGAEPTVDFECLGWRYRSNMAATEIDKLDENGAVAPRCRRNRAHAKALREAAREAVARFEAVLRECGVAGVDVPGRAG